MSLRLVRVVWGRLRTDWAFLLACWLLVVTAVTLVTAGALYADTVELGGVRRALAEANAADQGVRVRLPAKVSQLDALDGKVRPVLNNSFDEAGADVVLTMRSGSLQPAVGGQPGIQPEVPVAAQLVVLGSYEDLERHATIVDGRWPTAGSQPMEAAVSESAAAALGIGLGGRLQLADAATPGADPNVVVAEVQVVGIWRPAQRGDSYWLGDPMDLAGVITGANTTRGPLMVAREDLLASVTGVGLELRWRALPHVQDIQLSRIDALRADISGIPAALGAVLPATPKPVVNTKLADVLGTIDRSVAVSRGGVVLVILQFVLLAGYAVLLAGALLVERRRPEVALLRARGARGAQVGTLAIAESLAIAIPAVILAPLVALGVIELIGNVGAVGEAGIISAPSLSPTVLGVTLLAGLGCVAVVSLPALVSDIDLAHVRAAIGRPAGRTLAQRIGLDVVLLVVTAVGLFQLQSYGSPLARDAAGNVTLDPILVAAPALALVAGALLVIRLVPRIGEIADRLLRRQRGLTLPMASRQVARRPLRYTRTALLIVLATALGTFAATYTSTWADSQAAQASYQAGADIRLPVNPQSELGRPQVAATLAAQAGVRKVTPVTRERIVVGGRLRNADVLMLDASVVAPQLELPAETEQRNGATLLAAIGEADADLATLSLPAGTRRVAIVVDASLDPLDPTVPVDLEPVEREGQGIALVADVQTAGGTIHLAGRAPTFDGVGERIELSAPGYELSSSESIAQLLGARLQVIAPTAMGGDLSIVRVDASPTGAGADGWSPLAEAADLSDWSFQQSGNNVLHFDNRSPVFPSGSGFRPADTFLWGPTAGDSVSILALVNDAFVAASGSVPGDTVRLTYHGGTFEAEIVGAIPNFPSLDPTRPFLVIDRLAVRAATDSRGLVEPPTNEWWLWVDDGTQAEVAAALASAPLAAPTVVSEIGVRQSLVRDPISLGLVGALLLGSLAAAVCAAIGLIVGAIVTTRERRMETALLRALGMSRRGVTTGVALDNGYLLAFGLPAGIGLGILIALIVLPNTPLNRTGLAVVPAPRVVIPVEALMGLVVVGLVLLIVTVVVASRAANGARIADVLRAGED